MLNTATALPRLFCIAILVTTTAMAAPIKTLGFDDMSCTAWVASKNEADDRKLFLAWIRGVLTGHNYANQRQQVAEISSGTVENFVDRYCVQNPKGDFKDAALRLSDRFSGRDEPITK